MSAHTQVVKVEIKKMAQAEEDCRLAFSKELYDVVALSRNDKDAPFIPRCEDLLYINTQLLTGAFDP
jgi:hypothetical protein